ncbi:histidine kinase A domain protein [Coleofasciculus chthonoplastes PCC 7420]|uniref:histidine kinase n=1 Tax=Coleofasciculus chthonoplastes PCC 7420 TaxID=118168 RepID=B4VQB1_9CYAN|nr:histidine kinase A domain protein [Coleofasciculus chthonoplastes PCC 7420]
MVQKWLLPNISEVLAQNTPTGVNNPVESQVESTTVVMNKGQRSAASQRMRDERRSQREWQSAIASLEKLLLQVLCQQDQGDNSASLNGLVLAGPAPVLSHSDLLSHFQTGVFTTETVNPWSFMPFQLPPAQPEKAQGTVNTTYELCLFPADSLTEEQFCLVFTRGFSLVMAAGDDPNGVPGFRFSFDPEDVQKAWASLYPRLLLANPHQLSYLDTLVKQFAPQPPDYKIVMQFGRQLLQNMPEYSVEPKNETIAVTPINSVTQVSTDPAYSETIEDRDWQPLAKSETRVNHRVSQLRESAPDVELLQALTHEVRTPLTTIRTLTKLLLKRKDLAPEVIRRLEIIDHECTEQINRMELIFRAVELETKAVKETPVNLTSMSLAQIFQTSIPHWQKQAQRRNVSLDVVLPQNLPTVVSNPSMLDQVLTGLVENFTRTLPAGGHIQVQVTPAGDQLKLQFQSQPNPDNSGNLDKFGQSTCQTLKSIGQLLMFQPETGSLSLNLNVTKHLFQALGGKLIVRQRPQTGEVMTIFLPLEVRNNSSNQEGILV